MQCNEREESVQIRGSVAVRRTKSRILQCLRRANECRKLFHIRSCTTARHAQGTEVEGSPLHAPIAQSSLSRETNERFDRESLLTAKRIGDPSSCLPIPRLNACAASLPPHRINVSSTGIASSSLEPGSSASPLSEKANADPARRAPAYQKSPLWDSVEKNGDGNTLDGLRGTRARSDASPAYPFTRALSLVRRSPPHRSEPPFPYT